MIIYITSLANITRGGHPKRRNHHRIIARVRSLKNLPGIGEPAIQGNHVATDVLVLLPDTVTYHLLGAGYLRTDSGPCDRQQRSSGSTTGARFLTKLRAPEGSTSQCQPSEAPGFKILLIHGQLFSMQLFPM